MPIHRIALKNFKCFKETDVELSRITVLTGENSSGKSSLIYGILAPFQSKDFPLYLSPNGKYVNMGDFRNISFRNLKSNKIEIIAGLYNSEVGYDFRSVWVSDSNDMLKVEYLTAGITYPYNGESDQIEIEAISDHNYIVKVYDSKDNTQKNYQLEKVSNIIDILEYQLIELISFSSTFDKDYMNFISPFRLAPERTYYRKAKAEEKVGINGEGYIDQILEWEHQKAPQFKKLISILKKLELIRSLKTQQLKGGRFEVNVRTKSKGVWASLADVGFGISQFLPVIVADLQLSDKSTLLLAQPEIHLHPSVQASLADYFVNQIRETGKQYIIETHSEYLLNRLRLDIVKGILAPDDISVYYFEPSPDGSITYRIEFTKDGQIRNAPKGFFDTYMIDTMDIALYA